MNLPLMPCDRCHTPQMSLHAVGDGERLCDACTAGKAVLALPERSVSTIDHIFHMDALYLLRALATGSVDAIIADPPYNMTSLDFEQIIDWRAFWHEARRVLSRKNSPVILFSQQPFTTDLINSNRRGYKYEIIWHKTQPVGFLDANRRPLRCHENIQIFADAMPDYYPQMEESSILRTTSNRGSKTAHYNHDKGNHYEDDGSRYPRSVWMFAQRHNAFANTKTLHPTEKPLPLMERLILTYTKPGEIVLDCFAGSGSTLVAARKNGRRFIGCDVSARYIEVARERLRQPFMRPMLMPVQPAPGLIQRSLWQGMAAL